MAYIIYVYVCCVIVIRCYMLLTCGKVVRCHLVLFIGGTKYRENDMKMYLLSNLFTLNKPVFFKIMLFNIYRNISPHFDQHCSFAIYSCAFTKNISILLQQLVHLISKWILIYGIFFNNKSKSREGLDKQLLLPNSYMFRFFLLNYMRANMIT